MVVYLVPQPNTLPNVGMAPMLHITSATTMHMAGALAFHIVCAVVELNVAGILIEPIIANIVAEL